MYWIAFTLGFLGSLHCAGMCGPLSLAYFSARNGGLRTSVLDAFLYQGGRIGAYMVLGLVMGGLGSIAVLGGLQRVLTIVLGVTFLAMFVFSVHPDKLATFVPGWRRLYSMLTGKLTHLLSGSAAVPAWFFGFTNGLLPCGLVYLGISGALSLGNIWGGMGFMLFFGLGTWPMMVAVLLGFRWITPAVRQRFTRIYPLAMALLGLYLIYRGSMSVLPLELNFIEAMHHPVMCH